MRGFKKGEPRPPGAGRAKGTPNKKTEMLMEICERMKCNPFEGLVKLAQESEDEGIRLGAYKEVCSYLYPKRKAIEVSGPDGGPIQSGIDQEAKILLDEFKSVLENAINERRNTRK